MSGLLVTMLLTLGAAGVYLAMPRGRSHVTGLAMILVAGLAVAGIAGLLSNLGVSSGTFSGFTMFGALAVLSAVRVITHERAVYSALYFILTIISTTALLLLMRAEFLAIALIIIYAGAILVTYVFVIMLAQQGGAVPAFDKQAREPLVGVILGFVLLSTLASRFFQPSGAAAAETVKQSGGSVEVGTHLMTQYVVGVELAGVLLLAAMVGAIALARRKAPPLAEREIDAC
ncbi:MAG: NADH-quinone oxidoreductase subunit J [Phycisphaerales bacterium]|nr:NADH-quinone oxidoreductase subunit J [Phycisphaerales bacterium]